MDFLQRKSSFSVRNGTAEISLPFAKLSSFRSLISRKQLREIELQMVSAISFGWFDDIGKTLTIIQRSSQPVYFNKCLAPLPFHLTFSRNFRMFLLNGKHLSFLKVQLHGALFIVVSDTLTMGNRI